ncbi:MAG TPA: methyltransferase domain-containing protein [Longimicrobium sp.]
MKLRRIGNGIARRILHTGMNLGNARECPMCGWTGLQFHPNGTSRKYRYDARCPRCRSLERHRLVWVLLHDELQGMRPETLHVAPEPCIEPWLRSISSRYLSMDLYKPAMARMDLTKMTLEDASFSLIWCSHVLEHIPDDRAAMAEMFRVCRPGGTVVVQVPVWRQVTYENPSVTTREERLAHFYQDDHVRLYGMDVVRRLEEAGFVVDVRRAQNLDPEVIQRHGLSYISTNEVFVCTRP